MKKEKFEIGDKVFLIHLQQEGVVKRWTGTEYLYVEVDGDEIPVAISDVSKEIPSLKKEALAMPPEEYRPAPEPPRNRVSENRGLFISFEPVYSHGDDVSAYNIYLINDTPHAIDCDYTFLLHGVKKFNFHKPLASHIYVLLHTIEHDELNEGPTVQLSVRDLMNRDFTAQMNQKIRPQSFFKKEQVPPMFDKMHSCYPVPLIEKRKKAEPVKEEPVVFDPEILKLQMKDSVIVKDAEVEAPEEEIDLHIEKLTADYRSMSNAEMMQLQLMRFQQALERAIAHRAEKFYVIHGVGSGKLKQEIHKLLRQYKEVKSFNNDRNPRYGYGATEVILR